MGDFFRLIFEPIIDVLIHLLNNTGHKDEKKVTLGCILTLLLIFGILCLIAWLHRN